MFSQLLQDVFPYFSSNAVFIFTILSLSWLLWRIWRFTIFPALYPREPKAMPYLIPGVGHAISFFKDSEGVFTRSRKYFGNTREPFAVTVMGQQLYVVTSSADVSAVYRNTTTLSFDEFVRDMMLSIGGSEDGVRKMWESPRYETSKDGNSNRLHKILAHAGEDYYRQQLQSGDLLEALWTRAQDLISTSLEWNNISSKFMLSSQDDSKTLSLLGWCRETLLESVTTAVFGEKLSQLNPDLMKTFVTFDDDSWKMNYKLPRFLCEEMHTARETILATFQKYFALPPHERGGESWLVRTIETEMRKIEVPESDIAALFAMPFWVYVPKPPLPNPPHRILNILTPRQHQQQRLQILLLGNGLHPALTHPPLLHPLRNHPRNLPPRPLKPLHPSRKLHPPRSRLQRTPPLQNRLRIHSLRYRSHRIRFRNAKPRCQSPTSLPPAPFR